MIKVARIRAGYPNAKGKGSAFIIALNKKT